MKGADAASGLDDPEGPTLEFAAWTQTRESLKPLFELDVATVQRGDIGRVDRVQQVTHGEYARFTCEWDVSCVVALSDRAIRLYCHVRQAACVRRLLCRRYRDVGGSFQSASSDS